jgi:nitrogen fixation/metabolism regulation signal transduction histidine kinase
MRFNPLNFFPRDKRFSITFLSALFLLIISALIFPKIIDHYDKNWAEISNERVKNIAEEIQTEFHKKETDLIAATDELAIELKELIADTAKLHYSKESIFELLKSAESLVSYRYQFFENEYEPIAWTNQFFTFYFPVQLAAKESLIIIKKGNFRTSLAYYKRIFSQSGNTYFLAGYDNIENDYSIRNEYFTATSLESDFTKKFGTKIRLNFSESASQSLDGRIFSRELSHVDGSFAGFVYINRIPKTAYIEDLKKSFSNLQQLLFLFLIGILFFSLIKDFRYIKSQVAKILITTIFIWLIRIVLFYFQFPSDFIESELFNPIYFASRFGFGIVKSPGELFLTALALLINVIYIFILFRRWLAYQADLTGKYFSKIFMMILGGICLIAFPFTLRGYGAAVRSFVFDSSIKYFESASILPSFPFLIMHINVFLTSASVVIVSLIIYSFIFRTVSKWLVLKKNRIIIIVTICLLLIAGIVFTLIDRSGQFTLYFLLGYVLLLAFFSHQFLQKKFLADLNVILSILLFSSLSNVAMLFHKNKLLENEQQRNLTYELIKPKDQLTNFVLNETLTSLSNNSDLVHSFIEKDTNENFDLIAFKLWVNSILSTEGVNSSILLIDPYGKLLGSFGVGVDETDYFQRYFDPRLISQLTIFVNQKQYPNNIFGVIPVRENNRIVGFAALTLELLRNMGKSEQFNHSSTPKIFKSIQRERNPIELLPDAVIYNYVKNDLVRIRGEDIPESRSLPTIISETLVNPEGHEYWLDEKFGNRSYTTYYLIYYENTQQKIIAVSLEEKNFLWYVFNFFRLVFIHFLISVSILFLFTVILLAKGYRFHIRFKTKLFAGLLIVTIVPLIILAYYNRENSLESWNQSIRNDLKKELDIIEIHLKDIFSNRNTIPTADEINNIGKKLQLDFNVYLNERLIYSTQKKLYDLNFFQAGMSAVIYTDLFFNDKVYSFDFEYVGDYRYLVGFKKFSVNGIREMLISSPTIYRHEQIQKEIAQIDAFIFGAYSFTLILIFIFGSFIVERISKPISDLTEATKKVSQGDLQVQLSTNERGEMGALIEAFNSMIADLEESRKNLAQAEREFAWKEMAKQVAHEIKNPLTPMKLSLQHLQALYKENKKEFAKIFGKVSVSLVEQIEALTRITNEFSHFARMPKRNVEKCDLLDIIKEAVSLFASQTHLNFNYVKGEEYNVNGDREELKRIFINIFKNSMQASSEKINVNLFKDVKYNFINIEDNGVGISKENLEHIFEPNFSTKTDGMGLGLSLIKKIIGEMGGTIEIESEENKGTTVRIILPTYSDSVNQD